MIFTLLSLLPFVLVPIGVALIDYITLLRARSSPKHTHDHQTNDEGDFSILVPIFGSMSYLKNVKFLNPYGSKVILCTSTKESENFNNDIDSVAKENNFTIFRSDVPISTWMTKPNPWLLFANTLQGKSPNIDIVSERDEINKDSLAVVKTEYCIFIDGDTTTKESFFKLIGLMKEKSFDVASVRVLAANTGNIIEKLQGFEYQLAMDGRRLYPWLTSGAGMATKTKVIKDIMGHHSLFFSGGDIEIGKLAGMLKYKVGHLHFEFYTDVPSTFKAWFKQRQIWSGGGFRHAIVNFHSYTWRHPVFYVYFTILVYGATPLRWYEMIVHTEALIIVVIIYWCLTFIVFWKQRSWYLLLLPFYSLFQIMVILPLGVYRYFDMALHSNNVGLIKLRYKEGG